MKYVYRILDLKNFAQNFNIYKQYTIGIKYVNI